MTDPKETCEVVCNGQRYSDWTTMTITRAMNETAASFNLTVAENNEGGASWGGARLRPGDEVKILLAGEQVMTGLIYVRQGVMNDKGRAIMIQGASRTRELVISSHVAKGGQYKGYNFEQIASAVVAPYGFNFRWGNMPKGADKPFRDPQVFIGETSFEFLERLARQRGVKMHCDPQGDLVGDSFSDDDAQSAPLEEGQNIVSISAILRHDNPHILGFLGQQKGDDNVFGKQASQIKAEARDPAVSRYRPLILIAEEPSSASDLQQRADREMEERRWNSADVTVTVQGWHKPGGGLWTISKKNESIDLKAPSVIPTPGGRIALKVQSVTYAQDANGGSTTTLGLVLNIKGGAAGILPQNGAPNVLETQPGKAEIAT
jgi:prophage tail gpP-like protein